MSSWRVKTLMLGFFFFAFLIGARLFYWQILQSEKLVALASSQYFQEEEIPSERGLILTSDGFPLVGNKPAFLLYGLIPQIKVGFSEVATKIASILQSDQKDSEDLDSEVLKQKLENKNLVWVSLAKGIDKEKREAIENLGLAGIGFEEETKRDYPEGSMAAHLVGFVGKDTIGKDKGYFGLEGYYNRELTGRPGILRQEKDASGKPILIGTSAREEEVPGRTLELYLNREIQFMVSEKLKKGMERYGAKSGLVVIMDPQNGGILAMASFPSYDPANYAKTDKSYFANSIVAESFEPGSIFKVLVMAAAIDAGVVSPTDRCLNCLGPRTIGEYTIKTWDNQYYADQTMVDIIAHSDNVGMVYVVEKLGLQKTLEYLRQYGLGRLTGIDLEEELTPSLRLEKDWTPIDLATAGFGQGVAVTGIQMIRAVGAIANGGYLVEPHMVKKIISQDKEIEIKPKIEKKILSEKTTKVMTEMMVNAVEKGEAKWAKPVGYRIAGKTGTAQIPIAGHYDEEKTVASFVGFAPADNPRFVMLVTLREPETSPWGSETAAPLWFDMAREIFIRFGILP